MSPLGWFLSGLAFAAVAVFLFRLARAMWASGGWDLLG